MNMKRRNGDDEGRAFGPEEDKEEETGR